MEDKVKVEEQQVVYAHSAGSNFSDSPTQDGTIVLDCKQTEQISNNIPTTKQKSSSSSQDKHPNNNTTVTMSEDEIKIRHELETDIERDLEEELKDGIYHLAIRLHRLYQHKRENNTRKYHSLPEERNRNKKIHDNEVGETITEVNISIKMEGGTKIEIKETTKGLRPPLHNAHQDDDRNGMKESIVGDHGGKKVCWERTLRSGNVKSEQRKAVIRVRGTGKVDDESKLQKHIWKF